MKNREKLNQMSDEELAEKVCDFINAVAEKADIDDMCDICPFNKLCSHGHPGVAVWLGQEAEDNA